MTTPYPWNDSYRIGLEGIDEEHHKLFDIVARIYSLKNDDAGKEAIRSILYDLSDYMQKHFRNEEAYMAAIGYPELSGHRALHEKIVEDLNNLVRRPVRLDILRTKMKVAAKKMLVDHILIEDVKIKLWADRQTAEESDTLMQITNLEEI